ncbi:putative coiled coil domain protein [Candidatus Ichthyocystis hellenicum]|uniref:Putative coiled coil domain protein n=3 Tax=Candidatus Ichthyocystis TaxID=2929841 RepID=A0A0S4M6E5_9BURK|nr:hypothetical protein [Candidatus Ichthyocystis hellenicum]CUT18298.1 putative coiled coil domain protein [Candidatus Ichthyocystis hellenicum]
MVNQSHSSLFCRCYDLQIKDGEIVSETLTTESINLSFFSSIIRKNAPIRYKDYWYYNCDALGQTEYMSEIRRTHNYKKWKSKVNNSFKSIIENSLSAFATKLNVINCGSWEEKKCFLSAISGEIASNYPFKMANDLVINFVEKKISKVVGFYLETEIKNIANSKDRNYNELKSIIAKKANEALIKEDNKLELTYNISGMLSDFHEKQFIKEEFRSKFSMHEVETTTFSIFIDLYSNHLAENYDSILSKSVEIFETLDQDEESCMSFAFDKFFGEMISHHHAKQLHNFIHVSEFYLKILLDNLLLSGKIKFFSTNGEKNLFHNNIDTAKRSVNVMSFIEESKKELKEKITKYLIESDTIVFDGGTITICDASFTERVLYYSTKYLEEKLTSHVSKS